MDTFTPRLDILPTAQRRLWPKLRPIQQFGYVLYGGTAIALRLGHRQSVDFDFFNSKVKVILQRSESKDYRDIAALLRAGVRLETGLAAAQKMFRPTFPPAEAMKALVYFEDGDMARLEMEDRAVLIEAAGRLRSLPAVKVTPGLAPGVRPIRIKRLPTPRRHP